MCGVAYRHTLVRSDPLARDQAGGDELGRIGYESLPPSAPSLGGREAFCSGDGIGVEQLSPHGCSDPIDAASGEDQSITASQSDEVPMGVGQVGRIRYRDYHGIGAQIASS